MKRSLGFFAIIPAVAFGLSLSAPAFAQDSTSHPSASQSMEKAGADTESAAKNAYQGTATAVTDTAITAKVKLALHNSGATENGDIDVTTVAGAVTLTGHVTSAALMAKAEQVTKATEGVTGVTNQLHVDASDSSSNN
ncbi:MAG TPA: BON domain-containing protein [Candidatus Binataceae bacterium]|nr:BON domain-containing protein [Candidatus Binataceae bacterium]